MKHKRVRLQDVARAAGVSGATVSRVINRTGRVNPETAARVQRIAGRMKLDLAARLRPRLIAFVLGNRPLLHPFHSRILAGAEAHCAAHEYHVVFVSLQYGPDAPADAIDVPRLLLRQDILDGCILAGIHSQHLLDRLSRDVSPALAVQGNSVLRPWKELQHDAVWYDDVDGGYRMTRHLLELGHRDVWFAGNRQFPWFDRCYDGYARAMTAAGLLARAVAPDCEAPREAGYLGMRSLLDEGSPVTAIVAGSDATAQGVYDAVRDAGLRVPDDISVGGLDDIEASSMDPRLATVRIPLETIGMQLAASVIARIQTPGRETQRITIPTTLVPGDSCAPPSRPRFAARLRRVQGR